MSALDEWIEDSADYPSGSMRREWASLLNKLKNIGREVEARALLADFLEVQSRQTNATMGTIGFDPLPSNGLVERLRAGD